MAAKCKELPIATALGKDKHSFANFEEVATEHLDVCWRVDFAARALHGAVTHTLRRVKDSVDAALFDSRGLTVAAVTDAAGGGELAWDTPRSHPTLGTCLRVHLPDGPAGSAVRVAIRFSTQREPDGLQWLSPEQTLGGTHPYVFSQFQAILARTCVPCMDTPAVKASFDMRVDAPAPLAIACSGLAARPSEDVTGQEAGDPGGAPHRRYHYRQPVPVQSYLLAFVVGDIRRYRVGGADSRCWVWAEPSLGKKAAEEFSEMEQWVAAAEKLTGVKYVWGTYEVLVLPPFFAYGGMENPNLTTVNQAIVVGDKSLTDVVMHEIAHSWTGNLVTNSNWPDFWINEGFTMYLQRAIEGEVHGEDMRQFSARQGYCEYINQLEDIQEEDWRKLRPDILGVDPDEAFSAVPYEKGFALLYHLETLVGGQGALLKWIHAYLTKFARKSVAAEEVIAHFTAFYPAAAAKVDWDTWLYSAAPPPVDPRAALGTTLSAKVGHVFERWTRGEGEGAAAADIGGWHPTMVMHLLDRLLEHAAQHGVSRARLAAMDGVYSFNASQNTEVQARWLQLRLRARDGYAVAATRHFCERNGRGKYVKPIFNRLGEFARADPAVRGEVEAIHEACVPLFAAYLRKPLTEAIFGEGREGWWKSTR